MSAGLRALACAFVLGGCATADSAAPAFSIVGEAEVFAPDIASTEFAEVRLRVQSVVGSEG